MSVLSGARVVVTGGAGFIGSELVRQLAGSGARVAVVDDLTNGSRQNLDGVLGDGVTLTTMDFRHEATTDLLAGADVVYHLACLGLRHSIHSPRENHDVNATGTLTLLEAARRVGVGRFVHVSSSEVYGTARRIPMDEDHPTHPTTVYGAAKLAGDGYARAFFQTYGYPTVVVRPFNAYGPRSHHEGDSGEVIPRFILRCLAGQPLVIFGTGTQARDFTFVSDTARGILLAGTADGVIGETINLGQGSEISINDLAREVASVVLGRSADVEHTDPRPGDVQRLLADASKARRLLRFVPEVSLHEGVARTRDWYMSLGESPLTLLEAETLRNWERPPARS